jgi:hypothetical protein
LITAVEKTIRSVLTYRVVGFVLVRYATTYGTRDYEGTPHSGGVYFRSRMNRESTPIPATVIRVVEI